MKRFIAFLLLNIIVLMFSACNGAEQDKTPDYVVVSTQPYVREGKECLAYRVVASPQLSEEEYLSISKKVSDDNYYLHTVWVYTSESVILKGNTYDIALLEETEDGWTFTTAYESTAPVGTTITKNRFIESFFDKTQKPYETEVLFQSEPKEENGLCRYRITFLENELEAKPFNIFYLQVDYDNTSGVVSAISFDIPKKHKVMDDNGTTILITDVYMSVCATNIIQIIAPDADSASVEEMIYAACTKEDSAFSFVGDWVVMRTCMQETDSLTFMYDPKLAQKYAAL